MLVSCLLGAVASTSLHDEFGGAVDQNHGVGSSSSLSSSGGFTGLLTRWGSQKYIINYYHCYSHSYIV